MARTKYSSEPQDVSVQRHGDFVGFSINVNIEKVEAEQGDYWEADSHFFWEKKDSIDESDVVSNPGKYIYYIPLSAREKGKKKAQSLLDALRDGCPIIPVPRYREDASVCNRPADQIKLLAGLQMGGLPYYELASGEIVSLSVADLQSIALDITETETAMQQAKQACWAAIDNAKSAEEIEGLIEEFSKYLSQYA